ncbi:anti-sigma F factor antagonist [Alkaliphilus serpentinus]|uniref:Anti-sigma F factor antagonist n=1 Tax=Alkaliphilus serpentinus TaxID=1482731 RepID=A0A833HQ34_9FIRM|nr:anti-sigma F factor antagonist [Alkaliphilus serpentinus]KAB3531483.1 anti-sigma F factor antagonist [Alkaliphilus serpentinus]
MDKVQLKYETNNNTLIVELEGELDHHVAEDIRIELDDIIERKRIRNLIFDMGLLHFMDSSGIGVIMGRYKNISKLGGKVAVVEVPDKIDKIFTLAGLYRIVEKYQNKREAINRM